MGRRLVEAIVSSQAEGLPRRKRKSMIHHGCRGRVLEKHPKSWLCKKTWSSTPWRPSSSRNRWLQRRKSRKNQKHPLPHGSSSHTKSLSWRSQISCCSNFWARTSSFQNKSRSSLRRWKKLLRDSNLRLSSRTILCTPVAYCLRRGPVMAIKALRISTSWSTTSICARTNTLTT